MEWLNLFTNKCWIDGKNCSHLVKSPCLYPILQMLPTTAMTVTCASCVIYSLKYALHTMFLFRDFITLAQCNLENSKLFLLMGEDVAFIRRYRVYLVSLLKSPLIKPLQTTVVILLIKNARGLTTLLKLKDREKFQRSLGKSIFDVTSKAIASFGEIANYHKKKENRKAIRINSKTFTLTFNGYLYWGDNNEIIREDDFGLFLEPSQLKKCKQLLEEHFLIAQFELGDGTDGSKIDSGQIYRMFNHELLLSPFLHFEAGYYSRAEVLMHLTLYINNAEENSGSDSNQNEKPEQNEGNEANTNGNAPANSRAKPKSFVQYVLNPKSSLPMFTNLSTTENIKTTEDEMQVNRGQKAYVGRNDFMDDQTVIFVILTNILVENKMSNMLTKIVNLIKNPVNSRALSGFRYNKLLLVQTSLIEILGESILDNNAATPVRTRLFGHRLTRQEVESMEKLLKPGQKLTQIMFKNNTALTQEVRKKSYSAVQMFKLFSYRLHYYDTWNSRILFHKKIHPEDVLSQKHYENYSQNMSSNKQWLIVSCTVIPTLVILLLFIIYKYVVPAHFKYNSFYRKNVKRDTAATFSSSSKKPIKHSVKSIIKNTDNKSASSVNKKKLSVKTLNGKLAEAYGYGQLLDESDNSVVHDSKKESLYSEIQTNDVLYDEYNKHLKGKKNNKKTKETV